MSTLVTIDFEVFSYLPIKVGPVKYASQADIVCLCYSFDFGPVHTWDPSTPWPEVLNASNNVFYAHNALFELCIWNECATRYGARKLSELEFIDVMALCQRYGLPGALDKCCDIFKTPVRKDRKGKALIKKICVPIEGRKPELDKDYTLEELLDLQDYCRSDVKATNALIKALPASSLSESLQYIWEMTQRINLRGLPVDIESADAIHKYLDVYMETMASAVPEVTNGYLRTVNQHAKLREYLANCGYPVENTQAETLERALRDDKLPEKAREIIRLRQLLGGSATKKYTTLLESAFNGRVHALLVAFGAATGRWAGRRFQLHNLPRASVDEPDMAIQQFKNFDVIKDPMGLGKALIRPMISTAHLKEDKVLMVADYHGIENCILPWVAQEENTLQSIRQGECQYSRMAETIYDTPYSFILEAHKQGKSEMRQTGKIAELGCGFGMGHNRLKDDAYQKWNVEFSLQMADKIVKAYRNKHKLIVRLWYKLKDIVVAAISYPGHKYKYNLVSACVVTDRNGKPWLALTLPSGRVLYYKDPYLEQTSRGVAPGHRGLNPTTKQWSRRRLIPGRIAENVVQGLAFDIMANGMKQIELHYPEASIIGTVHDECISEVPKELADLDRFIRLLCKKPDWAEGLPLTADGFITKRYKKG